MFECVQGDVPALFSSELAKNIIPRYTVGDCSVSDRVGLGGENDSMPFAVAYQNHRASLRNGMPDKVPVDRLEPVRLELIAAHFRPFVEDPRLDAPESRLEISKAGISPYEDMGSLLGGNPGYLYNIGSGQREGLSRARKHANVFLPGWRDRLGVEETS